jgi:hypothetical protein
MSIAVFSAPIDQGPVALTGPLVRVVSILLPAANATNGVSAHWAIFGKIVVTNPHAAPQNVVAELLAKAVILDTTTVVMPGGGISQSISVEGTLTTTGTAVCVQIACAAPSGTAQFAQLIAISVDAIQASQNCTNVG